MIRYFVFTSLTTFSLCAQILDDFSDGNFTENPPGMDLIKTLKLLLTKSFT